MENELQTLQSRKAELMREMEQIDKDLETVKAYKALQARLGTGVNGNNARAAVVPGVNTGLTELITGFLKTRGQTGARLGEVVDFLASQGYPHKSRRNLFASALQCVKRLIDKNIVKQDAVGHYRSI